MLIAAELALVLLWLRMVAFCALGISAWWRRPARGKRIELPGRVSVVVPALDEEEADRADAALVTAARPRAVGDHRRGRRVDG